MRAFSMALLLAAALPARGDAPSRDPGRGHYLLAPSAFLLHGGEVVAAQREGLLSVATLGVADHLDVTLGSAAPALSALGARGFDVAFGLKGGLSIYRGVHVAAGFDTLSFDGITLGYLHGVTTVGTERTNVSVGVLVPGSLVAGNPSLGAAGVFLAGTIGLGSVVALATENWWFPARPQLSIVNAGMVRFTAWRLSLGLGAARIAPLRIPLPWVDLSFRVLG